MANETATPPATPPNYAAALDEIERLQDALSRAEERAARIEAENIGLRADLKALRRELAAFRTDGPAILEARVAALERWRESQRPDY